MRLSKGGQVPAKERRRMKKPRGKRSWRSYLPGFSGSPQIQWGVLGKKRKKTCGRNSASEKLSNFFQIIKRGGGTSEEGETECEGDINATGGTKAVPSWGPNSLSGHDLRRISSWSGRGRGGTKKDLENEHGSQKGVVLRKGTSKRRGREAERNYPSIKELRSIGEGTNH